MIEMASRDVPLRAILCVLFLQVVTTACGGGGDDQSSTLVITIDVSPPSASSDIVFLRERSSAGRLLVLDVVGKDIAAPLDGLDVVLSFDPTIVEAFDVADQTFLGTCGRTRPDNTVLVCADNIGGTGGANDTGVLFFSARPQGASPAPETIAGDRVLATLSLRGIAKGSTSVDFYVKTRPAPGGGSYSQVTSSADPGGADAVSFDPDSPNAAVIEVGRRS
jgi:hypothetical protein